MADYPIEDTLAHRLRSALIEEDGKPLAFVIGSGVTAGPVADTKGMLAIFAKVVGDDERDSADFLRVLEEAAPHARYQTACRFIIDRKGRKFLNRAVRIAVLRARTPKVPREIAHRILRDEYALDELERDTQGWAVPQGLSSLARVLSLVPQSRRGPILTTNFDPLIEVSLTSAGLDPWIISADGDGSINFGEAPTSANLIRVVHLHGSWRRGDTLHTSAQLNSARPKLLGGLREVLTHTTCLILGYGGWDDVLTQSLRQIIDEGDARDIEVLWACHSSIPQMGVLTGENLDGRLHPYVSVNSNTLIPNLEAQLQARIRPIAAGISVKTNSSELKIPKGLTQIDPVFILRTRVLDHSTKGLLAFFDGRTPQWVDVLDARVPNLDWVKSAAAELSHAVAQMLLFEGPAGEGKSTGLMQIAAQFATDTQNIVLWAHAPRADLSQVAALTPTSKQIWVFVDDADLSATAIRSLVELIRTQGRNDIKLVCAARDSDWRIATSQIAIPRHGIKTSVVTGLTSTDARDLVEAWTRCGDAGLGHLSKISGTEKRSELLIRHANGSGSNSLLGALLETRFGDGFVQHVRDLMARLSRVPLPNGGTLADAYLLICGVEKAGMPPLRLEYLSWFLGLESAATESLVVLRLGREAAARKHGDLILVRHPAIAQVACELAGEFGFDVIESVSNLIEAVVQMQHGRPWLQHDLDVIYSAQAMKDEGFALAAAAAASNADPSQLRLRCSRMGVFRRFKNPRMRAI